MRVNLMLRSSPCLTTTIWLALSAAVNHSTLVFTGSVTLVVDLSVVRRLLHQGRNSPGLSGP